MEEYKYAVVSGGLYVMETSYNNKWMLSAGKTLYGGFDYSDQTDTDYALTQIISYTYTSASYTNKEIGVSLVSDTNTMLRYKFSITFTATSNENIIGAISSNHTSIFLVSSYGSITGNQVVLSGANNVTCDYYIDFYYPGSGETYSFTKNATKYPLWDLVYNTRTYDIYLVADITSYSIQNLYGTVLTDRILNTLYT